MAESCVSNGITFRLSPVIFGPKGEKTYPENADLAETNPSTCTKKRQQYSLDCTPIVLEFRRLFQSAKFKSVSVIPGVPNQELLHAIVALYDVCLPDITPEVLYFTVCGKWAKTLILLQNSQDVAKGLLAQPPKSTCASSDVKKTPNVEKFENSNVDEMTRNKDSAPVLASLDVTSEDREVHTQRAELMESHEGDGINTGNHHEAGGEESNRTVVGLTAERIGPNSLIDTEQNDAEIPREASGTSEDKETKGIFADVFSDTESEKDVESDEDEEEDFTAGQEEFLRVVKDRREQRRSAVSQGQDPSVHIGIESRLLACATWEKSQVCPGERTVQLDLLAVRKRYRKCGIGKYLVQTVKDTAVVGLYDSLVVYADHSAVDFFGRFGFDDDIILNSKFSDLADNWTNCTLMCYLPPFSGQTILLESDARLDMKLMDLEMRKWSGRSRDAYQAQMTCAARLKHEVIALRAMLEAQRDLIGSLTDDYKQLRAEKSQIERDNFKLQLANLKNEIGMTSGKCTRSESAKDDDDDDSSEDAEIDRRLEELDRRLATFGTATGSQGDSEVNPQIAEEFTQSMDDSVMAGMCIVTKTTKACLSRCTHEMFTTRCNHLSEPVIHTRMYLCGTLQHPERISTILEQGFSEQDFSHGEFGVGLYFSRHASKAAHFSALGKLLLADVHLGKTESVVKRDNTRTTPPEGSDSIVTPGRLSSLSGGDVRFSGCQEYVVFDPYQAVPLYLIEYKLE